MRVGKWVLGIAALGLLFAGSADAQTINANTLCVHTGGGYYVNGGFFGYPNHGGFHYFPSYSHIPAQPISKKILVYPWKIAGWAWTGMQANLYGPTWYWEGGLQYSTDNPYATSMSFDYPALYCTGTVPHTGAPMPIYGGSIPTIVPIIGGRSVVFPSSMGGFDPYLNIFAVGGASWVIPSTLPFYGWLFGFFGGCASAITQPSANSIVQIQFTAGNIPPVPPFGQYLILGQEVDCLGAAWAGQKGRNYTIISDVDNGYLWYWPNGCTGTGEEWAMCLWVCDSITIPVNAPGFQSGWNPFLNYGFDVGAATITPYLSSNCVSLGFMSQDYTGAGGTRVVLAAFALWGPGPAYGKKKYRIPHGWDSLTNLFNGIAPVYAHTPVVGYPACMFGTTIGANSVLLPFPYDPALQCAEIVYSTWASANNTGSAGYTATYF
jgi:hypothetical protein